MTVMCHRKCPVALQLLYITAKSLRSYPGIKYHGCDLSITNPISEFLRSKWSRLSLAQECKPINHHHCFQQISSHVEMYSVVQCGLNRLLNGLSERIAQLGTPRNIKHCLEPVLRLRA